MQKIIVMVIVLFQGILYCSKDKKDEPKFEKEIEEKIEKIIKEFGVNGSFNKNVIGNYEESNEPFNDFIIKNYAELYNNLTSIKEEEKSGKYDYYKFLVKVSGHIGQLSVVNSIRNQKISVFNYYNAVKYAIKNKIMLIDYTKYFSYFRDFQQTSCNIFENYFEPFFIDIKIPKDEQVKQDFAVFLAHIAALAQSSESCWTSLLKKLEKKVKVVKYAKFQRLQSRLEFSEDKLRLQERLELLEKKKKTLDLNIKRIEQKTFDVSTIELEQKSIALVLEQLKAEQKIVKKEIKELLNSKKKINFLFDILGDSTVRVYAFLLGEEENVQKKLAPQLSKAPPHKEEKLASEMRSTDFYILAVLNTFKKYDPKNYLYFTEALLTKLKIYLKNLGFKDETINTIIEKIHEKSNPSYWTWTSKLRWLINKIF